MGVGLLQVLARTGDVERDPHHLEAQLLGYFQQVPTALQREAKSHAGLSSMGLGGQLQQQPGRDKSTRDQDIRLNQRVNQ